MLLHRHAVLLRGLGRLFRALTACCGRVAPTLDAAPDELLRRRADRIHVFTEARELPVQLALEDAAHGPCIHANVAQFLSGLLMPLNLMS